MVLVLMRNDDVEGRFSLFSLDLITKYTDIMSQPSLKAALVRFGKSGSLKATRLDIDLVIQAT
jgi:hypothetical protein